MGDIEVNLKYSGLLICGVIASWSKQRWLRIAKAMFSTTTRVTGTEQGLSRIKSYS